MATAHYRTKRGAERYAAELRGKWPAHLFTVVPSNSFGYCVRVDTGNGRTALAGKRPAHFGRAA